MMNAQVFLSTTGKGLARAERSAGGSWTVAFLLEGRQINCLAADPHKPGRIFAGTQGDGLLCSDDRGQSWRPHGRAGQVIKSIAFSKSEPGVVYLGTKPPALFVSRDAGQTWQELESFRRMRRWFWFTPAEPGAPYVQGLSVSPTNANVLLAGIEFGAVLYSADGGQTWQGHLKGAVRDCHTLMFHASSGDWVYEAGGGGVAFSRDGGITWQQPKTGLDRRYGWACAADPARPEVWYASLSPMGKFPKIVPLAHVDGQAAAFIFRRTGDGPWERLGGGLPQPLDYMAYALLTDPAAPGHLYAGLSSGDVWHTADYGESWQQLPVNLGSVARTMIIL